MATKATTTAAATATTWTFDVKPHTENGPLARPVFFCGVTRAKAHLVRGLPVCGVFWGAGVLVCARTRWACAIDGRLRAHHRGWPAILPKGGARPPFSNPPLPVRFVRARRCAASRWLCSLPAAAACCCCSLSEGGQGQGQGLQDEVEVELEAVGQGLADAAQGKRRHARRGLGLRQQGLGPKVTPGC